MPQLSISKTYADGTTLFESDLDNIKDGLETFINTTKLDGENIQDSAIVEAKIAAGAVTAAKIASSAVTTAKIQDSAVTTAKIQDGAVTAAKLASDAVTTAKIVDANVTTAKIADEAVTQAKVDKRTMDSSTASAGNIAVNELSGINNSTSTSFVELVAVTLTTLGGPVKIGLISNGSASAVRVNDTGSPFGFGEVALVRDSTTIAIFNIPLVASTGAGIPVTTINTTDVPAAGTYTYKLQVRRTSDATSIDVINCKLVAYEEN